MLVFKELRGAFKEPGMGVLTSPPPSLSRRRVGGLVFTWSFSAPGWNTQRPGTIDCQVCGFKCFRGISSAFRSFGRACGHEQPSSRCTGLSAKLDSPSGAFSDKQETPVHRCSSSDAPPQADKALQQVGFASSRGRRRGMIHHDGGRAGRRFRAGVRCRLRQGAGRMR